LPPPTRPFVAAITKLFCDCTTGLAFFDFLTLYVFFDNFMCFLDNFNIFSLAALPPDFHLPPNAFRDETPTSEVSSARVRLTETPREK